jgi:hypothetical protein
MGTTSSVNPHTGTSGIRTDPFVLSMDYSAGLLASESAGLRSTVYLGWLNPTGSSTGTPQWQNAALGNFGAVGVDADTAEYQGSFTQFIDQYEFARDPGLFPSATDPAALDSAQLAAILGSYGLDSADNSVWAAIDHNSSFAAVATFQSVDAQTVPEPSGAIPVVIILLGLLLIRRQFV